MKIKARITPPNLPIELTKLMTSNVLPLIFMDINSVIMTVATAKVDPNPIPYINRQPHSQ